MFRQFEISGKPDVIYYYRAARRLLHVFSRSESSVLSASAPIGAWRSLQAVNTRCYTAFVLIFGLMRERVDVASDRATTGVLLVYLTSAVNLVRAADA